MWAVVDIITEARQRIIKKISNRSTGEDSSNRRADLVVLCRSKMDGASNHWRISLASDQCRHPLLSHNPRTTSSRRHSFSLAFSHTVQSNNNNKRNLLFMGPGPDARIVYIDGAFDLFHAGHVEILRLARELGDFLLVGIQTDQTVRFFGMSVSFTKVLENFEICNPFSFLEIDIQALL